MKNKTILLVIGLALVLLLAVATIFYQDLSQQYAADPITPTQNPSVSQEAGNRSLPHLGDGSYPT